MSDYTKEQQRAINSIEKNTAVLAGAGSGKTSVLVERFIRLVASGIDPQRILAVTFTNKAAGEMSARIRERMGVLAQGEGEKSAFWAEKKKLLANASIGTIHTLCASILRSSPVEAQVEPGFAIAEEAFARILLEDAVKEAMRQGLEKKQREFLALCSEYGYATAFAGLRSLLTLFSDRDELNEEKLAQGNEENLSQLPALKADFLALLGELLAGASAFKEGTAHRAVLDELKSGHIDIERAVASLPSDSAAAAFVLSSVKPLAKRNKDKELVGEVKQAAERLAVCCLDYKAKGFIAHWAAAAKYCIEIYERHKRQRALLTFDDLERLTHRLLLSDKAVLDIWAARFDHIMIDEFQDTNQRQKELAYLLAGKRRYGLENNKLFVVGDAKQSVYRFRGADVSVFGQVRRDIKAGGGEEIQLADNFRSSQGILAVCNDLFSFLLAGASVEFEPLLAHKEDDVSPVEALFIEKEADCDNHLAEARLLVARFCRLVKEEGCSWGDMAILLRTRTRLPAYMAALQEAGVPHSVLDGQGFFAVPEISDMLNLLAFLANERQILPLVGALRSPLFALDDETITRLSLTGHEDIWQALRAALPAEITGGQRELSERARQKMEKLLEAARFLPVGRLLRLIIEELAVMPLLLLYPDGKQKYANMEKLVDLAFAFEQEEGGALAAFVAHINLLVSMEAREGMEKIETEDSAAVKILTVHKSKGLQFPVVAVADCGSAFYTGQEFFFYEQGRGLGIKVRDAEGTLQATSFFSQLREEAAEANVQEMKRLLYVAMTRAEKKLILSGVRSTGTRKCWLNWLLECFEEKDGCLLGREGRIHMLPITAGASPCPAPDGPGGRAQLLDLPAVLQRIKPLPVSDSGREPYSATALSRYRHCARSFYYKYVAGLPEEETSFAGGEGELLAANVTGLIVHGVLDGIGALGLEGALDAALSRYCPSGADPGAVKVSILLWLKDYLSSPLFKNTFAEEGLGEVVFRLPLLSKRDGGKFWFSGSIDRLIFNADGSMSLVDYKTDRLRENKTSAYEHQMMLYALAAEALYPGRAVKEASLHFIRLGEAAAVDVTTQRTRLIGEIADLCSDIESKNREADFAANTAWCRFCGFRHCCQESI